MSVSLQDICNNNLKNMPSQDLYDNFNNFIFSSDIKVLGNIFNFSLIFYKLIYDRMLSLMELNDIY
jgi:hypothetical protein